MSIDFAETTEQTPLVGVETGVAATIRPLIAALLGDPIPIKVQFWDGSTLGPDDSPGTLVAHSIDAVRRIVWSPGELGVARAYVAGDIDIDGAATTVIACLRDAIERDMKFGPRTLAPAVRSAGALHALGRPPKPPSVEVHPRGWRHSKTRDASAISHHYDVGNDFYELVLGPSMAYSCARFIDPSVGLADAQASKHELICRKLGLHERPGVRLLDVGCGWGSMAIYAATHHRANVVGVTISRAQADLARQRVDAAGVGDRVEIRVQDYRELGDERFDAISSVGMFEHVGAAKVATYFETLHSLLTRPGRLLNHAISSVGGSKMEGRSFIHRYVFPDGELIDVGEVALAMERAGFEVRDVESLREHYARTLRHWVTNLEGNWERAVALVGDERARVWRLYMAASAVGFEDGGLNLHQVLGVAAGADGTSAMPATRDAWTTGA